MTILKKLATAAAFVLCALAPATAMAQKALFLSTEVASADDSLYGVSVRAARDAFKNKFGTDNFTDGTDKLSSATISDGDFQGINVVVVATGKADITEDNYDVLANQIKNNPNLAFIIFSDGCGNNCKNNWGSEEHKPNNLIANGILRRFVNTINGAAGMMLGVGDTDFNSDTIPLNNASKYSGIFSRQGEIDVQQYALITNAAEENKLYANDGDDALAIFVPKTQMNGGACVFLAGELTMWKGGFSDQRQMLTDTLYSAVNPNSAACNGEEVQKKVLFLTTQEPEDNLYNISVNRAFTHFSHASYGNIDDRRNVLNQGSIDGIDFSKYESVVVLTGATSKKLNDTDPPFGDITPENLAILSNQMKATPNNLAFIIFSDGCGGDNCRQGDTLRHFTRIVQDASGMPLTVTQGKNAYSTTPAALNTASSYKVYFSDLESIRAENYSTFTSAYLDHPDNLLYSTDEEEGALAIFMPSKQMGGGACTFLAGDLTIFKHSFAAVQGAKIAQTLLDAVRPGSDACEADPALPPEEPVEVLFLSTAESGGNDYFVSNTFNAFVKAAKAEGKSVLDKRYALTKDSGVTFDESDFVGKKVVVVATKEGVMGEEEYKKVEKMMQEGKAKGLSFIIFTDSCNNCAPRGDGVNPGLFEASLKDALTWEYLNLSHIAMSDYSAQPLNKPDSADPDKVVSPWYDKFQGFNPSSADPDVIRSHVYGVLECLPTRNKLFEFQPDRCDPVNAGGSTGRACTDSKIDAGYFHGDPDQDAAWKDKYVKPRHPDAAFTALIPQWQSYKSAGACIIFTDDINVFDQQNDKTIENHKDDMFDHQEQQLLIATKFLAAATNTAVCGEEKPDDICLGIGAEQCELKIAPTYNPGSAIVVQPMPDEAIAAGGIKCPAAVWCDDTEENRKDEKGNPVYCSEKNGETSTKYCCQDCTPKIKETNGYCTGSQTEDKDCCMTCKPVAERDDVCEAGQKPGETNKNVCCRCNPKSNPNNITNADGFCCTTLARDGSIDGKEICCATGNIQKSGDVNVCCGKDQTLVDGKCMTSPSACPDGKIHVPAPDGACCWKEESKRTDICGTGQNPTNTCCRSCTEEEKAVTCTGDPSKDTPCCKPSSKCESGQSIVGGTCCWDDESKRTKTCDSEKGETPDKVCCKPSSKCESGQSIVGGTCCWDDESKRTKTCDSEKGETPDKVCCKPSSTCEPGQSIVEDGTCCWDDESLRPYCCEKGANKNCCRECGPEQRKENGYCEDEQSPEFHCCICKPMKQRRYCKDGEVPFDDITKSGTKEAVVACCRPRPSSGTPAPVPANSPWALGLLGAAVAFAATRRRRQSKRRDDDA